MHNIPYKNVDFKTWCSDKEHPAGGILADILNEIKDNHLSSKVSTHIHRFYIYMSEIAIHNQKTKEFLAMLIVKHFEEVILTYKYPKPVETHLLNLITGLYRKKILRSKTKINKDLS